MKAKRAHIWIPQDLLAEIDKMVGPRGRSAFLLETAREALKRKKLLRFLDSTEPVWKDSNHPELARGSGAWVRDLRRDSDERRKSKPERRRASK